MAKLSQQEIDSYLAEPHVALLTSIRPNGRPHVAPVWFVWQSLAPGKEPSPGPAETSNLAGRGVWQVCRALVMTGASSLKARNLRNNPSVALSVASDSRPYQYVSLEGEASLTQDNMAELVHRICTRYDGPEQGAVYARELLEHGNMVVIDVQVERIISWKQDD